MNKKRLKNIIFLVIIIFLSCTIFIFLLNHIVRSERDATIKRIKSDVLKVETQLKAEDISYQDVYLCEQNYQGLVRASETCNIGFEINRARLLETDAQQLTDKVLAVILGTDAFSRLIDVRSMSSTSPSNTYLRKEGRHIATGRGCSLLYDYKSQSETNYGELSLYFSCNTGKTT